MAPAPRTRYAKCGDMDIAYQVFGDGPRDLLIFPSWSIPIDCIDADPAMARFHRRLGSFCRVIRFDQRGIGLSSRVPSMSLIGPDVWFQDAVAVLDAVGIGAADVMASGHSVMSALVMAAQAPDRVRNLILINGAARVMWAPDYPVGAELSVADPFLNLAVEPDAVERGFDALSIIAPTVATDDSFRAWWDMSGNRAASPSMAKAVAAVVAQGDVRDVLARVATRALIIHRDAAQFVTLGHGHYLRDHLPQARYIELAGADSLYWVGETGRMLDEIQEFLTGNRGGPEGERVLATVLFTDIVASTEWAAKLGDVHWRDLLDKHDQIVRHELERFRGVEVNTAGDGFVATFLSPSGAIDCAEAIVDAVRPLGIEVRAGIHAGEIEMRGADIAGMAVHICARVAGHAASSEVLVSSTVRDIVTGSGRAFVERGEHALKGVPGIWRLYSTRASARE
ncbi:MAG: adenylate/guanylate cyclase domain-containing protein [Actinomycetota bacterium]|nr:adenylate/guanylate cyclase domain-containing protein [Actinomycetota bacterium]